MTLANWQNIQPPVRGKDSLGNIIDDGSASRSFRRVEFMSGNTAIGLIEKLEDAGMEPALSIDPDFTMDSGEIRKRYLYTIPEGTFPLGAVFALTFGKTGKTRRAGFFGQLDRVQGRRARARSGTDYPGSATRASRLPLGSGTYGAIVSEG